MPHPIRLASLVAVASGCLLSCGSTPDAPEEGEAIAHIGQSIMGGVADPDDTAVVAILNTQTYGFCTGSLIAPNLVLTAQHCVAASAEQVMCSTSKFGAKYSASGYIVAFTEDATAGMSGSKKVAQVYTPPDGNLVCGYDIALMRLVDNVSPSVAEPIIPRVDRNVEPKEVYKAVGYGNTNDTSGAGRRRMRDGLKVSCVGDSCMKYYMDVKREWEGDTGICQGDSGGPALDSTGRVIGVVSRGQAGCDSPVYGSVYAWAEWIKQVATEAAQKGGYEPAAWVTGGSTEPDAGPGTPDSGTGPGSAGTPCSATEDCNSGVCVFENNVTYYCSEWCSDDTACPQGWFCDTLKGACFQRGAFGDSCGAASDCRSGLCVSNDSVDWYCSLSCSDGTPCPGGASCSSIGNCFKVTPAAAESGSGSTSGCSTAGGRGATQHAGTPWYLALALLALRRRRNRGT